MITPHKHHTEENIDSWLMSYADMITLLMCFFIIFVSVSEPKKERLSAITNGIAGRFGTVELATPFDGVLRDLATIAETNHILKDFALEKKENSVEMELAAASFFQPNSVEFNKDKLSVLSELADALKKVDYLEYRISVEAHTSDAPVNSGVYPTNWEFSGARAARIVRLFIAQGIKPEHLRVVGYGDTDPKVPNEDGNGNVITENRIKNERLVIKLERAL
jgi:chemotaxis protein MotB